jgi:hypothetical protein
MGEIDLTCIGKMGYNGGMLGRVMSIIMRIVLVMAIWLFVWGLVEPKTQAMRILRAALLLICLLCVLAALRMTGQ